MQEPETPTGTFYTISEVRRQEFLEEMPEKLRALVCSGFVEILGEIDDAEGCRRPLMRNIELGLRLYKWLQDLPDGVNVELIIGALPEDFNLKEGEELYIVEEQDL